MERSRWIGEKRRLCEERVNRLFAPVLGRRMGLPLVEGEHAHEGGYRYYPELEQVRGRTRAAGFEMIRGTEGDGYYHHLLARGS